MLMHEIEKALEEINKPGSDLNVQYHAWLNDPMTNIVGSILQARSAPDQMVTQLVQLPGDIQQTSSYGLGFVSGRSKCASEMFDLDALNPSNEPEPEADFSGQQEGE